jgi:hypothetical protein
MGDGEREPEQEPGETAGVFGSLPRSRPGRRSPRRAPAAAEPAATPVADEAAAPPPEPPGEERAEGTEPPEAVGRGPDQADLPAGQRGLEDLAWAGVAIAAEAATLGIRLANRALEAMRGDAERP